MAKNQLTIHKQYTNNTQVIHAVIHKFKHRKTEIARAIPVDFKLFFLVLL